jgi:hypothetical protein
VARREQRFYGFGENGRLLVTFNKEINANDFPFSWR